MVMFNSYVKLPEGKSHEFHISLGQEVVPVRFGLGGRGRATVRARRSV